MSIWESFGKIAPLIASMVIWLSLFGVINNIIGAITGTSPVAGIASSLIRDVIPVMIQLMPFMMIMSMIRSMFMGFGVFYF